MSTPLITISRRPVATLLAGAVTLLVAGCAGSCPPIQRDTLYVLDLFPPDGGASAEAGADGAAPVENPAPDGGGTAPDGGDTAPDSGRAALLMQWNCSPLAEGCTPGQSCPAACACVLAREQMGWSPTTVVDQCVLASGAHPPSIEVRTHLQVDGE